ncbi:MAG: Histidine ammonia-lyase [Chlamydiae bacterium]|nr:Histidine ammonia-lyase [Chlamydiota bacterium]
MEMISSKDTNLVKLSKSTMFSIDYFCSLVNDVKTSFYLDHVTVKKLDETRDFIDYLVNQKITVYGLSTGFADLRDKIIPKKLLSQLSKNLIRSHDAAVGNHMPMEVVKGAMILRVHSLSMGNSGMSKEGIEVLIQMLNSDIIPLVPETGSLGASGDLAFLSRLGMAMMGEKVLVNYQGTEMDADAALKSAGITPFFPKSKEGLALINGTSFLTSYAAIAYKRLKNCLNHLPAMLSLFLTAVNTNKSAFYQSMHNVRGNTHQSNFAKILCKILPENDLLEYSDQQDDYCIRCLPQILGPRFYTILEQEKILEAELNAVTDNPLIFKGNEISAEVSGLEKITFNGSPWCVISGGNFHGENIATSCDIIRLQNAKIALTLERQMTYMLNPFRNKGALPCYLINSKEKEGLYSGFMIAQYTANALTQKICHKAAPVGTTNLTSGNESEDIVSYAATAAQKLLEQVSYLEELFAIYLTTALQAYSLSKYKSTESDSFAENVFSLLSEEMEFPRTDDESLSNLFEENLKLIRSEKIVNRLPSMLE